MRRAGSRPAGGSVSAWIGGYDSGASMRPLEGCLVLDFSTLSPGPLATLILAEAGAEVVKISGPVGMRCVRGNRDGAAKA